MKVAEWLAREPGREVVVTADADVQEMLEGYLASEWVRDLFVVDEARRVIGWISARRLASLVLGEYRAHQRSRALVERLGEPRAGEVMNPHFRIARPDEEMEHVVARLVDEPQEDLPVVGEAGELVGILHLRALLERVHRGRQGSSAPPPPSH